jgi:hypothetical protein
MRGLNGLTRGSSKIIKTQEITIMSRISESKYLFDMMLKIAFLKKFSFENINKLLFYTVLKIFKIRIYQIIVIV